MILPISGLPLATHQRVSQIAFHPKQPFVAVQSHDRSVEVFRIRTEEEIKKKLLRRQKREKEKTVKGKKTAKTEQDEAEDDKSDPKEIQLIDLFTPYLVVRSSGKIRSFDFSTEESGSKGGIQVCSISLLACDFVFIFFQLFLALASNALEVFSIPPPQKSKETPEAQRLFSLDLPGHRTDIRTLSLSSDDELLASASNGSCYKSQIYFEKLMCLKVH
jgi:U3 small nucleolar RNA-associated protein 12